MADDKPTHWIDIQSKCFTRWCNVHLKDRGYHIDDLRKDFVNGINLIQLMEILSGKSVGRYNKHPRVPMQTMENCSIAIDFITNKEQIHLVNIGGPDIQSGNEKLILGLIWTLILRYDINKGSEKGDAGAKAMLLEWVQKQIPEYNITNFRGDWNDGRAICALVNSINKRYCGDHKVDNGALENAQQGISTAERHLGIEPLVLANEMINKKVNEQAMMTYIAQFRNIADNAPKEPDEASMCSAYGPGLVEGVAGKDALFTVECDNGTPQGCTGKLEVVVKGPQDQAKVNVVKNADHTYSVSYMPTTPGKYEVSVTMDGVHIPGSVFHVEVLAEISLGGEGKIRVFYSTTSSSNKSRTDQRALQDLLEAKKVHLRPDFEPWIPVDIMERDDRFAVFEKAGTKTMPIVFIDDKYVGDYEMCAEKEERGELDKLLSMDSYTPILLDKPAHNPAVIAPSKPSPSSKWGSGTRAGGNFGGGAGGVVKGAVGGDKHVVDLTGSMKNVTVAASPPARAAPAAPAGAAPKKFCGECGAKSAGKKFCGECGKKI